MENDNAKYNIKELLTPGIAKNCSRFLEILEQFDNTMPTRDSALVVKKAMGFHKDPVLSFLLKKSLRLAVFKLKGTKIKNSLAGLNKLLNSPDRLDDLALAISTVEKAEAFLAIDYLKEANWKNFPQEILPCFCMFFKNNGNSQDCDDILELTRHPNPIVIAAAVEAIKKLDTGSLRSIIEPLIKQCSASAESEAIEQLYVANVNHDSSNISNESKEYYDENHQLLIDSLKNGTSELETVRILRLIKKYGNEDDAEYVKPYLTKDKPDIVRAAIKVLEKLDKDYLCVYLPQMLQDSNAKIRLTATRAFQSIDKESVVTMVLNLITSLNIKQRSIGITTAMLVDFNKIRMPFLKAFGQETSEELLEKIGLVIAANPDRELVKDLYSTHRESKTNLTKQRQTLLEMVSEKVSISIGGNPTAEELYTEAMEAYESRQKELAENPEAAKAELEKKEKAEKEIAKRVTAKASGFYKGMKMQPPPEAKKPVDENSNMEKFAQKVSGWKSFSTRTKMIIVFLLLGAVFWGLLLVMLLERAFY